MIRGIFKVRAKGSALYIVIVVALVIALFCAAMITAAYYYRAQAQKKSRYDRLANNLSSAIKFALNTRDSNGSSHTISLFQEGKDSITIEKYRWGIYNLAITSAFIQHDTLYKAFLTANVPDTANLPVLYLTGDARRVSVSGKTFIRGDAYLPEAGIKDAYINNQFYEGDKRLVIGKVHISAEKLPEPDEQWLNNIEGKDYQRATMDVLDKSIVSWPFNLPTLYFGFEKKPYTFNKIHIRGNIELHSDTTLIIDSTSRLENVLVYAPVIIVKRGFKGSCQLFAKEKIIIEPDCYFEYPSCAGIICRNTLLQNPPGIFIGEHVRFDGVLFTWDNYKNKVRPLASIAKGSSISGQVYVQGRLEYQDNLKITGSVFTDGFRYQHPFTIFDNFLINMSLDAKSLSSYYLFSPVFPGAGGETKILKWLDSN